MKRTGILLLLVAFWGCKQLPSTEVALNSEITNPPLTQEHPGLALMKAKCYLCHNPDLPEQGNRIAPPMVAVKGHYLEEHTTREAFSDAIWNFVQQPEEESTLMRGAIRRFGLMPYQDWKEEEIRQIADYLYSFQIEEPEWFRNHWEGRGRASGKPYFNTGKAAVEPTSLKTPLEIGKEIALETKKALAQTLMKTVQEKGPAAAVEFCNLRAYPITDSMAVKYNAKVKRVSDQLRNPNNVATEFELNLISAYKKELAAHEEPRPVLVEKGINNYQFYGPITTNSLCLKCHGNRENMEADVLRQIKRLYPQDQAVGYKENELRGIWSIAFSTE